MTNTIAMTLKPETPDEQKDPMWVHCGSCSHEWICAWLPMPIPKVAPLMKAPCPRCGSKPIFMGKLPRETREGDAIAWLGNGDIGVSSATIWTVMMGRKASPRWGHDVPHDPADFGRCYRLLKAMPLWRSRLGEVAVRFPEWQRLVDAWDELTALYEEELPSGSAPKLYRRIKECID